MLHVSVLFCKTKLYLLNLPLFSLILTYYCSTRTIIEHFSDVVRSILKNHSYSNSSFRMRFLSSSILFYISNMNGDGMGGGSLIIISLAHSQPS